MVKIEVKKPFIFNNPKGEKTSFGVGIIKVDESTANHWFVKAHCAIVEDEKPVPKKTRKTKKTANDNE